MTETVKPITVLGVDPGTETGLVVMEYGAKQRDWKVLYSKTVWQCKVEKLFDVLIEIHNDYKNDAVGIEGQFQHDNPKYAGAAIMPSRYAGMVEMFAYVIFCPDRITYFLPGAWRSKVLGIRANTAREIAEKESKKYAESFGVKGSIHVKEAFCIAIAAGMEYFKTNTTA